LTDDQIKNADKIAYSIENDKTANRHLLEERNMDSKLD
jgi:PAB1-binding protein PBP1